ncbi:MAG TPA: hypothetical protein VMH36_09220 [Alphaproteobacteria bacterium]|nr:hypothetical protein [Alphaproteobacteria bacterium]
MKPLCAALCGASGLLLLAACEPTYETPAATSPVTTSPTAMYAAPAPTVPPPAVAVVPPQHSCVYTSRSYVSGSAINPPELPGTTLQCVNGTWHSI